MYLSDTDNENQKTYHNRKKRGGTNGFFEDEKFKG